jgi:nicotinate-nucleotide pyrophosphorylase (carboxylating)
MRPLLPDQYRDSVRRALAEDIGAGDVTTQATVRPDQRARGIFLAKSDCVLAGVDVVVETFRQLEADVHVTFRKTDGDRVKAGESFGEVIGSARTLLVAERTALNFLQRLSGIATAARRFVDAAPAASRFSTRENDADLRRKYAVAVGGATNHRVGLFDAVLIETITSVAGGVSRAVALVREHVPTCRSRSKRNAGEVDAAVNARRTPCWLTTCPFEIRGPSAVCTGGRRSRSQAVQLERIPALATTGADFVSAGALTIRRRPLTSEIEPL